MSDWNQFKGDPRRTGLRRDLEGPARVSERWTSDLAGPPGSPVCDRDTVFVGTRRGNCYALERETGDRRWTVETTAGTATTPVVTREACYLAADDGTVRALDPATGDRLWQQSLSGALEGALGLADERLYVGHADGVSALAADTGEVRWTRETDSAVVGAPAIDLAYDRERSLDGSRDRTRPRTPGDNGDDEVDLLSLEDARMDDADADVHRGDRVYVGTADGAVRALAAEDGEELWDAPVGGSVVDGPTVVGERVYVADDDGTLVALHADSGQSWFTYGIEDSFTSSPTVLESAGATFLGAADGYLHVTDTTFGRRKLRGWLFSKKGVALDGPVRSSPVVAGDVLCVGDATGSLYGVDVSGEAEDCDLVWYIDLESGVAGTPALGDGELFVGSDDGRLHCLEWESDRSRP